MVIRFNYMAAWASARFLNEPRMHLLYAQLPFPERCTCLGRCCVPCQPAEGSHRAGAQLHPPRNAPRRPRSSCAAHPRSPPEPPDLFQISTMLAMLTVVMVMMGDAVIVLFCGLVAGSGYPSPRMTAPGGQADSKLV